jgi:hypothetical protein
MPEPLTRVDISADGPGTEALKVAGHLLPFVAATLELDATQLQIPLLTVSLPVVDGLVATLDARISLAGETRAALMAMGWTPPAEVTSERDHAAWLKGIREETFRHESVESVRLTHLPTGTVTEAATRDEAMGLMAERLLRQADITINDARAAHGLAPFKPEPPAPYRLPAEGRLAATGHVDPRNWRNAIFTDAPPAEEAGGE